MTQAGGQVTCMFGGGIPGPAGAMDPAAGIQEVE